MWWVPLHRHLILAALANWCGWTPAESLRAPLGVIAALFEMHIRDQETD
jgi:hypothetical protein